MFTHEELSSNSNLIPFGLPEAPAFCKENEALLVQNLLEQSFKKIVFDSRVGIEDIAGEIILKHFIPSVNIVHSDEEVKKYVENSEDDVMVISRNVKNNRNLWFVENNGTDKKYIIAVQNIISKAFDIPAPLPAYLYRLFTDRNSIKNILDTKINDSYGKDILRYSFFRDWSNAYKKLQKYVGSLYMQRDREYTVAFFDKSEDQRVSEMSEEFEHLGLWQFVARSLGSGIRDVNFVVFESSNTKSEHGKYGILSRNIPVSFAELPEDALSFVAPHSKKMENVLYGFVNCNTVEELNTVLCELAEQRKKFYFEKTYSSSKKNNPNWKNRR